MPTVPIVRGLPSWPSYHIDYRHGEGPIEMTDEEVARYDAAAREWYAIQNLIGKRYDEAVAKGLIRADS